VLDTRTPSVARAYDHLLGGEASFVADRALAGRLLALYPQLGEILIASRTQVADAVARIARQGVDQYLDVGAGLPTRPSTHATARAVLPAARVAYVDRDPLVVEHGTDLIPAGVRYYPGDLTEPEALLATLTTIDVTRPVCLVLALVVQALDPGTARAVVSVLVKALSPGSYLIATVGAGEAGRLPDAVWPVAATEPDLAAFFGGLDLLPPGVTRHGDVLCGVGVKPYPRRAHDAGRPRG
jgi:O-methyltransferase involved in polyketide biosynthesis